MVGLRTPAWSDVLSWIQTWRGASAAGGGPRVDAHRCPLKMVWASQLIARVYGYQRPSSTPGPQGGPASWPVQSPSGPSPFPARGSGPQYPLPMLGSVASGRQAGAADAGGLGGYEAA